MHYAIASMCAAALAVSGAARAEPDTKSNAADEKAVGKIASDWTEAWNRHDAAAMAGVFADRGDLINPMGKVAKGHDEILKLFQTEQAGRLKQSKMALTCEPTRFFSASVAQVDCDYTLAGLDEPNAPGILHGHVTDVVVKDGQRWSIISSRAMVPRPDPAAKAALTTPIPTTH
jgi:uncharacterized protein (TIGR02246 family)